MAYSPFLLGATLFLALMALAEASSRPSSGFNYTTVTGYFLQDEPSTAPATFDYLASNFGLINRVYDADSHGNPDDEKKSQWERFENQVDHLNRRSGRHVQYKVLYLGRHGEGYHNVAEAFYGTPAWDCYWSKLDGNGSIRWDDARITESGIKQAQKNHDFWAHKIANENIPVPETYYTSPLTRCLETANITFSTLKLPSRYPFLPVVKELLREGIGIHTCDRRGSKSSIHAAFPIYRFEPTFAELDPLWKPNVRETDSAQEARLKILLDDVFKHDRSTFISFTSHSGSIAALLRVIKHRPFSLGTGAVIPVLVKAERPHGQEPPKKIEPSTSAPVCTANPTPSPKPSVGT